VSSRLAEGLRDEAMPLGTARLPDADELLHGRTVIAARGDDGADLALAVETVYEGYLLHYRRSRVLPQALPDDSRLLAGDYLYAHGLRMIAADGDIGAVDMLTRLMASCSYARVEGLSTTIDDDLWSIAVLGVAADEDAPTRRETTRAFGRIEKALEAGLPKRLGEVAASGLQAVRRVAGPAAPGTGAKEPGGTEERGGS